MHDITEQVTAAGKNTVGMIAGQVMDSSQSIIGLVMVQLSDGSKPYFVSTGEQGWKVGPSYYTVATAWKSMIDWTKEEAGWSTPGFTPSSDWMAVAPTKTQTMPARALMMPFTTVLNEVKPVVVEKLSDGAFLYVLQKQCQEPPHLPVAQCFKIYSTIVYSLSYAHTHIYIYIF